MRYTFAPTSTLCPIDCARTSGAESGWCFAGPGKADSQLAVFFFLALVLSLGLLWTLSRLKQNLFQPPLERVFLSLEKGEPGCYVRLRIR